MKKTIFFIDGFNVYHAIANPEYKKYKWLNYKKFANQFINRYELVVGKGTDGYRSCFGLISPVAVFFIGKNTHFLFSLKRGLTFHLKAWYLVSFPGKPMMFKQVKSEWVVRAKRVR